MNRSVRHPALTRPALRRVRPLCAALALWLGTQAGAQTPSECPLEPRHRTSPDATRALLATPVTPLPPPPCEHTGRGTEYRVGPDQPLASLDEVPWERLKGGDTVRIFHRAEPYRGKFVLSSKGSTESPLRICGVRGPHGERPVISGDKATTRRILHEAFGSNDYARAVFQARSLIVINSRRWDDYPSHIQIDGLHLTRAHPDYRFTDASGKPQPYTRFGAAIWIERGQNIRILDNEISDSQMGVFSKSTDDGPFAQTRDIRLAGNHFHDLGIKGSFTEHSSYTQSTGMVIEFNRYGPLRAGALGNSIKDRSVGTVVRYNRIEDGAHAVDLVEAEDAPKAATAEPTYRTSLVHGNLISKNGDTGSFIHYGGDHYGTGCQDAGAENSFRKGTLYFFDNTVHITGSVAHLFQISTTHETVEAWNNLFVFAPSVRERSLRMDSEVAQGWTGGGILNLGRNWISHQWQDIDQWHKVRGQLNGKGNLVAGPATGQVAPIDLTTYVPLPGSVVIDAAVNGPEPVGAFRSTWQISASGTVTPRKVNGKAADIGAIER